MSRNTKIVVGVVVGLLLLCACGVAAFLGIGMFTAGKAVSFVNNNISSEPEEVNANLGRIADVEPPQGFTPTAGVNIMSMTLVGYNGPDERSQLMLIQFPAGANLNIEEMQKQMQRIAGSNTPMNTNLEMKVIDETEVTVRGQTVPAYISEASDDGGRTFNQMTVKFDGKVGPTLLVYGAPADAFDPAAIEDWLASMK